MSEEQYPSEMIDLPSRGKLYSNDSPLREGKLELKYMTAKEEDILTSQNLIKKGVVLEKLLDSLILTKGVTTKDLIVGDKNAVMVAARILGYGPEYTCEIANPITQEPFQHTFNLADCPFKETPKDIEENNFEFELPISKTKITFKLLTGREEKIIENELKSMKKVGSDVATEMTARLRYLITSVNGDSSKSVINKFVTNMLSRDSFELRKEISRISPDIDMKQEIDVEGDMVTVEIPMTANFFWPNPE